MKGAALGAGLCLGSLLPGAAMGDTVTAPGTYFYDEVPCNYRRYSEGAELTRSIPDFQRLCYLQARARMERAVGNEVGLREADLEVRAILEIDPASAYGWTGLAELHLRYDELNVPTSRWKMREIAQRATVAKPALAEAFIALAEAELRLGCLPCADDALKRAEALAPDEPRVLVVRAALAMRQGRTSQADALFERALTRLQGQARALASLRQGAELTARGDLDRAERAFESALKEAPDLLRAHLRKAAFLLYERANPDAAAQAATRSLQIRSTVEAKRLISLAGYLKWAMEVERTGQVGDLQQIMQRALVTPEEAFVAAAAHRSMAKLTHALGKAKAVRDVNVRDGAGDTALIVAARSGNHELVSALLDLGARVDFPNNRAERALTFAAAEGNTETVRLLLVHRASPDYADLDGSSPLSVAVFMKHGPVTDLLLRQGAKVDGPGQWNGGALLNIACSNGDLASVKALLDHGVDPNAPGEEGILPLVSAVLSGSRATVDHLLAHGADVRQRFQGRTAVDYARDAGDWALVRALEAHARSSI